MKKTDEERKEEFITMQLKMRKIQDDVLNDYFTNPATIKWNVLESLRPKAKACSELWQFRELLEKELEHIANTLLDRELSYIESVEYRFIKKIYRDVIKGKGKEFDQSRDLIFKYDDQTIEVEEIKFGESEFEQ